MNRETKFRFWHEGKMYYFEWGEICNCELGNVSLEGERMQFTGLTDKNGKEIYEYDIVEYSLTSSSENKIKNEVVYEGGAFYPICEMPESEFLVLGNIHENPKLIEKQLTN